MDIHIKIKMVQNSFYTMATHKIFSLMTQLLKQFDWREYKNYYKISSYILVLLLAITLFFLFYTTKTTKHY